MDAFEFAKERVRMCDMHTYDCHTSNGKPCPAYNDGTCAFVFPAGIDGNELDETIKECITITERWARQRKPKSRKDVLLEKFPNADCYKMCVRNVFGNFSGCDISNVQSKVCKVCWDLPAPDEYQEETKE